MNLTRKTGVGVKPAGFLLLGVGAIAAGAIWILGLTPLQAQVDNVTREVTAVEGQIAQTRQLLDQAQSGGAAYLTQLEQAAVYADELLPSQFDAVELLTIIPPSASTYGVRAVLSQDNPNDTQGESAGENASENANSGNLKRLGTRVEAIGPITSILEWLNSLKTLTPVMTIDSVSIAGIDGETTATVTLSVWYTTSPPLAPNAVPNNSGGTDITPLPDGGAEVDIIPLPEGGTEVDIIPLPEGDAPVEPAP